jgi:hypothetical protein
MVGGRPDQSTIDNRQSAIHYSRRLKPAAQWARPAVQWAQQTSLGVAVAVGVYLLSNPYIVINLFVNREVLQSNFGNSLAMYEIARVGEGFLRVVELTIEGATLPVVVLGVIAPVFGLVRRNRTMIPLVVAAAAFFLQFVLIGAGKPAEYGRFGIFPNTALAIAAACLLTVRWTRLRGVVNAAPAVLVVIWALVAGGTYLANFYADTGSGASRLRAHLSLRDIRNLASPFSMIGEVYFGNITRELALLAEPAPYNCPPINFATTTVLLFESESKVRARLVAGPNVGFLQPYDGHSPLNLVGSIKKPPRRNWFPNRYEILYFISNIGGHPTPISWANKPFLSQRSNHTFRAPY